jgi:outer membrane protein OmpA-like peptidoglycan-associated protein
MKRYILTESQLNNVIQNKVKEETLNEGSGANIAMAALMTLTSVAGSYAKKTKKNPKQAVEVEMVQQKAAQILSKKENISFDEALKLVQDAGDNYEENYSEKRGDVKKTMRGNTEQDLARVLTQLKHGYAIKGVHSDTIRTEVPQEVFEAKVDTQTVTLGGENLFTQGSFELNDESTNHIKEVMESLNQGGRMIVGITVESSTDKERVSEPLQQRISGMEREDGSSYDAGNQGLSEVRNDQMSAFVGSELQKMGVDQEVVKIVKWEQGEGEIGAETPQDASARYVNVHFFFVELGDTPTPKPHEEITIVTVFELAKPKSSGKTLTPPPRKYDCYKGNTCPNPNKTSKLPKGSQLMKTKWKNKGNVPLQKKMGGAKQTKPFHGR